MRELAMDLFGCCFWGTAFLAYSLARLWWLAWAVLVVFFFLWR